jgi:hypothetical protein
MKSKVWILHFLCFISHGLIGQHWEVGLSVGTSFYKGDLEPIEISKTPETMRFSKGIFTRYQFSQFVTARLNLNHFVLFGDDQLSQNPRNLNFETSVFEVALIGELNLLGFDPQFTDQLFSPFLYAGIAYFHFNPRTFFEGEWHDLQPLRTEGQGLPQYPDRKLYSRNAMSIPIGGGLKYSPFYFISFGLDIGGRLTFSDYLDDVSTRYAGYNELAEHRGELAARLADREWEINGTAPVDKKGRQRGNPEINDFYFLINFTVSINLYDLWPSNLAKKTGCPYK